MKTTTPTSDPRIPTARELAAKAITTESFDDLGDCWTIEIFGIPVGNYNEGPAHRKVEQLRREFRRWLEEHGHD